MTGAAWGVYNLLTMGNVNYVARVCRQHNSLVITVPKGVCQALGVDHGCLVDFNVQTGGEFALFSVLLRKDGSRGGNKTHSDCSGCDR